MKPILHKVELKQFTAYQKSKICGCSIPCKEGVTVTTHNDGFTMCWSEAKSLLKDLLGTINGTKRSYAAWTKSDIEYITDHIKENGIYKGVYQSMADVLGKTRVQVRDKVTLMKKHEQL